MAYKGLAKNSAENFQTKFLLFCQQTNVEVENVNNIPNMTKTIHKSMLKQQFD